MRIAKVLLGMMMVVSCLQTRCGMGQTTGEAGNQGAGNQGSGTQQAGTQQAGTQQAGTQGAGTQQAGTQLKVDESKAAYSLPPEKLARAIAYSRQRTVLGFVDTGWGVVVLLLLLTTGTAAWMQRVAVGLSENKWVQGFTFFLLFLVITTVLGLPLDMYGHHLSVAYGQSVQHWGSWFGDIAKSFGLTYLFGGLLVMLLFLVIGKSPTRWWFWFWIPTMVLVVAGTFVYPIFIDPLFNKFEPLMQSNATLVGQLEQVVARGGIEIPPQRMYLMKASEKVTGLNAYVTGIGASKRVVVWDTTIAKATPEEIQFIFGHEMGHYVLNHIYKGMAFTGVLLLVLFWLGYRGMQLLLARYGEAWGIAGQDTWSAFVVLMLVVSVASFFAEPITSSYQRGQEHAADVYGQEAIHGIVQDPQAVAQQAFQVLGEQSLTDPNPNAFVEFWTFSHPSIGRRAEFAKHYNPWVAGGKPEYFEK
jgi:STE24 endopeptidase